MRVSVNNKQLELFRGATVLDAVRSFSKAWTKLMLVNKAQVLDRFGNVTLPDGELSDGQILFIRKIK